MEININAIAKNRTKPFSCTIRDFHYPAIDILAGRQRYGFFRFISRGKPVGNAGFNYFAG